MNILIAEDEHDIAEQYKTVLEKKNHHVVVTENGEECLTAYHDRLKAGTNSSFDVVVLDQRMPKKDGMQVAKEILKLNPDQRIIFASAYVRETLADSLKELNKIVEVIQKPFRLVALVDTVEDKESYEQIEKLNVHVRKIKDLDPSSIQIRRLLEDLSKIQKPDVWYAIGDIMVG